MTGKCEFTIERKTVTKTHLRREETLKESFACSGRLFSLGSILLLETLLLENLLPAKGLGVGVETEENSLVDQGVLFLGPWALLNLLTCGANNGLDLVAVDQTSDVGVGDLGGGEDVILLVSGSLLEGTEHLIEETEGTLSPDNKAAKVSTGGELEEVETADVDELNTRKVAESLDDTIVFIINNERTTALAVPAVPELALSGTELAGVGNLDDISVGVQRLEEGHGLLGLGEGLSGAVND